MTIAAVLPCPHNIYEKDKTHMNSRILAFTLTGIFAFAGAGFAQSAGEHLDSDFKRQREQLLPSVCQDMSIDVGRSFLEAARLGKLDVVKCLSARQSFDKNYADENGMTGLMWASRAQTGLSVEEVMERNSVTDFMLDVLGMNVHAKNKDGAEALATAAITDNLYAAKRLVEKGADFFAPDGFNETPYDAAKDMVEFAQKTGGFATRDVLDYFDALIKEKGLKKPDLQRAPQSDLPPREMHEMLQEEMQKEPPSAPLPPADRKFEM